MSPVRRSIAATVLLSCALAAPAMAQGPSQSVPVISLAEKIASVLGPAQAHLVFRNISSLPNDALPAIRRQLETELKARGISLTNGDSGNTLRVTLSENNIRQLWVAEVLEGSETHVVMVAADRTIQLLPQAAEKLVLHKRVIVTGSDLLWKSPASSGQPVLAAAEAKGGLIVMTPDAIAFFAKAAPGWQEKAEADFGARHPLQRDPRGSIHLSADGNSFTAFAPGVECSGSFVSDAVLDSSANWTMQCRASDDPWLIVENPAPAASSKLSGFYSAGRNYFTGVVAPSIGVDLPPFYTASSITRSAGSVAFLFGGIDGAVKLAESGVLKSVSGTRDWGSDFAVLTSTCGNGQQVLASSSGQALADSLRAYEMPAQEAIPVSAPLATDGTVTALAAAPDGQSVYTVVRTPAQQGQPETYEVDRVTATCD